MRKESADFSSFAKTYYMRKGSAEFLNFAKTCCMRKGSEEFSNLAKIFYMPKESAKFLVTKHGNHPCNWRWDGYNPYQSVIGFCM